MAFLFIGAELEDFPTKIGTVTADTTTLYHRTAYARCGMSMGGGGVNWVRAPFAASSSFWMSFRMYTTAAAVTHAFVGFYSGGALKLQVRFTAGFAWQLEKVNGGTVTVLATSSSSADTTISGNPGKIDIEISYGTSGYVKMYANTTLVLTYSGDVTTAGATTLDEFFLQPSTTSTAAASRHVYTEVIVATENTLPLSVKTIAPSSTGDTTAWTSGTWADLDEIIASDADLAVSDTANQVLAVNCTGMPTGSAGLSVRALKSTALGCRGVTGPSKLALGVRQSSTNGFATGQTLDIGYGTVSTIWATNPVTGSAFTASEIEAIQLAYRSET